MIVFRKIKASALQFAVLVATMVALFLSAFLTLTQTHRFFAVQSQFLMQSIQGADDGIRYGLQAGNPVIDSVSLEAEYGKTKVKKEFWGGFEKIESTSEVKTKEFKKIALIGGALPNTPVSIYMADDRFPLVLVGKTKLEGTAYISPKGVKPGNIAGHYYTGGTLIDGPIRTSNGALPKLDAQWLRNMKQLLNYVPGIEDVVIPREEIQKNSFFQKTHYIYEEGSIVLSENYLGNIVIISKSEVKVTQEARLQDAMVVAPKITIEKGFTGNAHFIAEEQIKIEEEVTLTYPSSLVLLYEQPDENKPVPKGEEPVSISDFAYIGGNIIVKLVEDTEPRSYAHITMAPETIVEGTVYCEGNVELKGTVKGSVYANTFVARESGSIYVNHLYDGKVLGRALHEKYCGLPFTNQRKGVAKWLY